MSDSGLMAGGIKNTDAEIRDGVLNDATKFAGGNVDAAVSGIPTTPTLQATWTNAKAAFLDAAVSTRSTHAPGDVMDVDISGYAGVKAGAYIKTLYDDWLNGGRLDLIVDAIKSETGYIPITAPQYELYQLPNGVVEQTIVNYGPAVQYVTIRLDMSNLTQKIEIREYEETDAVNYRQISFKVYPDDFDVGTEAVVITFMQINTDYKVTLKSQIAEGAVRDIPFRSLQEVIE